jgi:hypothetical protein
MLKKIYIGVVLVIVVIVAWRSLPLSDAENNHVSAVVAAVDALNRRECAILMQARADTLQIEIERETLYGSTRAREYAERELAADRSICERLGVSPYTRSGALWQQ